jgi:uncharacterized protein YbjT (DUF2867 family)
MSMNLVVGATGLLGSEICRQLAAAGQPVRALVRVDSDASKVASLAALQADIVRADLKDRASLDAACRGARTVISTASSTLSHREGDSIASVDHQGQLNLIAAAKAAGVEHFVLISFPPSDVVTPLQDAKRSAEAQLRASGMSYTILQPTLFMEVWLSPMLGFDAANARAQIYGDGKSRMSPISLRDVAQFAVASLGNPAARNATIQLGGPDTLTLTEIVALFEQAQKKPFAVQHVPQADLRAQWESATDPLQKSFAGLMLQISMDQPIPMADVLRRFPTVKKLGSLREMAAASCN